MLKLLYLPLIFSVLKLILAKRKCLVFKKRLLEVPPRPLYFEEILEGKALIKNVKIMCLSYWSTYFSYWSTVKSIVLQKHIQNLVKQFSTVYSISKNAASHIFNPLSTKPTKWVSNTALFYVIKITNQLQKSLKPITSNFLMRR